MLPFTQLFLANLKLLYRNTGGLFWTVAMPVGLYIALSVLPIPNLGGQAYKNFVLPGMIAYTLMSGGIYGLAYWMTDMKAKGVLKRFLVAPIQTRDIVLSLVASRLMVMFAQVILLTFIGKVFLNAQAAFNPISILLLTLLGGGIFLMIGLLISAVATSYESAAPLTAAIGMPFAFLGNVFFPTQSLPTALRAVSEILPITYLAEALRNVYTHQFSFQLLGKDFLFLFLWFLFILALTLKIFKLKE